VTGGEPTDREDRDDELIAELLDIIDGMVANGELELASRHDHAPLANRLFAELRGDLALDVADWLVAEDVVNELYLDGDELASRLAPLRARLDGDEPVPRWNEELAARITEAPDDATARAVFGDWLQQAGDPRGELVQLQLQREARPDDRALAHREGVFVRRYRRYLLGPLADHDGVQMGWSAGFLERLDAPPAMFLEAAAHPSLRFLRRLRVRGNQIAPLAGHLPAQLVALELAGDHGGAPEPPVLHELVDGVAALEELTIAIVATVIDLGALRLPHLRTLRLDEWASIAGPDHGWRDAFPALERVSLTCRPRQPSEDAEPAFALLAHPPPRLTSLHLTNTHAGAWLRRLVDAPLLAQLTALDLSGADLEGLAPLLQQHGERFAHLASIDVRSARPSQVVATILRMHPRVLTGLDRVVPTYPHERYRDGDAEDEDDDDLEEDDEVEAEAGEANETDDEDEDEDGDGDETEDAAPPEVRFEED
jgi:uncharacterized protein (TIGR02996 family)